MSDQSHGPGWWLASDGKWYPPQPDTVGASPGFVPGPRASALPSPNDPGGTSWIHHPVIVGFTLWLCLPIGLVLVWTSAFKSITKWVLTSGVVVFWVLVLIAGVLAPPEPKDDTTLPASTEALTATTDAPTTTEQSTPTTEASTVTSTTEPEPTTTTTAPEPTTTASPPPSTAIELLYRLPASVRTGTSSSDAYDITQGCKEATDELDMCWSASSTAHAESAATDLWNYEHPESGERGGVMEVWVFDTPESLAVAEDEWTRPENAAYGPGQIYRFVDCGRWAVLLYTNRPSPDPGSASEEALDSRADDVRVVLPSILDTTC